MNAWGFVRDLSFAELVMIYLSSSTTHFLLDLPDGARQECYTAGATSKPLQQQEETETETEKEVTTDVKLRGKVRMWGEGV